MTDVDLAKMGMTIALDVMGTGNTYYSFDSTVRGVTARSGPRDCRLLVKEDGILVSWALLEWAMSESDGSDPRYSLVAYGEGVAGALREGRHIYFGEDGYVYMLNAEILIWGLSELKEWFDFN